VRDLLLERPSLDFDLVVEGDAIALARALSNKYGGRVTGHARFGTAKWHLDGKGDAQPCKIAVEGLTSIDLVTARTEFYTHPTALPTVERGSIKLDLHRRDFTINTMALRLDGRHYGELHDYWGGLEDLRNGLVRVLHSLSFVDDPTRILRAARFEQRFAFRIEKRTMELLLEARGLIERLSGDRIRHELNHILASSFAAQILHRLNELELLKAIHPDLPWDDWLAARIESLHALGRQNASRGLEPEPEWELSSEGKQLQQELGYVLWLMTLPQGKTGGVVSRLKLPAHLGKAIAAASRLWEYRQSLADAQPSAATALLEDVPPLARYALYLATNDYRVRGALRSYVTHWKSVEPCTDGHALRARGMPPGPHYKHLLQRLRDAWLDGEVSTPEQEQAFLERLLKDGEWREPRPQ
jgi:tRNA nucleotidyltransferase (CCA-adding enzyme)